MKQLFRALLCVIGLFVPVTAHAQFTQVTATSIRVGGRTIANGTVCAVAVDGTDNPITVAVGGGGLYGVGQNCANIVAGAITTDIDAGGGTYSIPDEAVAGNSGFFYDFVITDSSTKQSFSLKQVPNVTGSIFVLDHYFPVITVPTVGAFTFTTGSGAPSGGCAVKSLYDDISIASAPVLYQCGRDSQFHLVSVGGGSGVGAMLSVNNLSDVANATTARANLGLGSAALVSTSSFDAAGAAAAAITAAETFSAIATNITSGQVPLARLGTGTPLVTKYLDGTGAWSVPAGSGGGTFTPPTGSGFFHITSGAADGAARAVDVSSADVTGILAAARHPALTGDITTPSGSIATTLATVNGAPGACGDATHVCVVTTNGKGLVTTQTTAAITGSGGLGDPGANGLLKRTAANTTAIAAAADVVSALATDTVNNSSYGFHTGSGGDTTCPTPTPNVTYHCQKAGVEQVSINNAAYVPFFTTIPWSCQPGYGDGLNVITAGTYPQSSCYNDTGKTITISGIKCFTNNSGTSTMNVTNGAGTALLTGAITCTNAFATGTQSATVTIAAGDFLKFSFAADGTSAQATFVLTGTHP